MTSSNTSAPPSNIYDIVLACMAGEDDRGWTPFFVHFLQDLAEKVASQIGGPIRKDAPEEFPTFVFRDILKRWRSAEERGVFKDPLSKLRAIVEEARASGGDEADAARGFLYSYIRQYSKNDYIKAANRGRLKLDAISQDGEDVRPRSAGTSPRYRKAFPLDGAYREGWREKTQVSEVLAGAVQARWERERRADEKVREVKNAVEALRSLIGELRDLQRVPFRLHYHPLLMELEDRDLAFMAERQKALPEEERLFDATAPLSEIRREVEGILAATGTENDTLPHKLVGRLMAQSENTATANFRRACKQLRARMEASHVD